jgi:hypothetical protein
MIDGKTPKRAPAIPTPSQTEAMRTRRAPNRQATQEAREIARNGGPGYASVKAMLDAMQQDRA